MMEHIDTIRRKLLVEGHKLTDQRERILLVLLEHDKSCMSAEEVYILVKHNDARIGLATVYRTLDLFSQLQILKKIHLSDQLIRYELRLGDQAHSHHHLVCKLCSLVTTIDGDWLLELEKRLMNEFAFTVKDHQLVFTGFYRACNSKVCERTRRQEDRFIM